jgi:hypothetical protein
MKHYTEKLSEFVDHELANDERQAVAEHLLQCAECRAEHDEIKFGAALAGRLQQADAPENLWNRIENSLDGKAERNSRLPNFAFFSLRGLTAAAVFLLIGGALAIVYFNFLRDNSQPPVAQNEKPSPSVKGELPPRASTPPEIVSNHNTNPATQAPATVSPTQAPPVINSKAPVQPPMPGPTPKARPKNTPVEPRETLPGQTNRPSWNVETLAGMPKVGNSFESEKLAVGETLETDANSRARVQVANIGNVEIAPNSRVKLVGTKSTEHRLSLEKGVLKAKILAPPRLFIVDTPAAAAVDLGCEYTLEVDAQGNGKLHVTGGFVALERGGREAIVPAGAIALTKKGKGVGTPFSEDASPKLRDALYRFDFENGGREALEGVIREASLYDSITLWHLFSRVEKTERGKVFDALAAQIKPPARVTREGILKLDKKMLDAWWREIEIVWFE